MIRALLGRFFAHRALAAQLDAVTMDRDALREELKQALAWRNASYLPCSMTNTTSGAPLDVTSYTSARYAMSQHSDREQVLGHISSEMN